MGSNVEEAHACYPKPLGNFVTLVVRIEVGAHIQACLPSPGHWYVDVGRM